MEQQEFSHRLGVRVRTLRTARGLTQADLAKRLTAAGHPLHTTTITKLENGARPTLAAEIEAMAAIFGVPVGAMFGDDHTEGEISATLARLLDRRDAASQRVKDANRELDAAHGALVEFIRANEIDEPTVTRLAVGEIDAEVLYAVREAGIDRILEQ